MAVTGGGGDPARARVLRAAVKRAQSGKALAHGYIKTPATPNFQGNSPVTRAQSSARTNAKKASASGGYGSIAAPTRVVRSLPRGGVVGNLHLPSLSMPRLPDLMPRANAATKGISPRRVTTGGEGIGAGQQSYFDIGKFLNGLGK